MAGARLDHWIDGLAAQWVVHSSAACLIFKTVSLLNGGLKRASKKWLFESMDVFFCEKTNYRAQSKSIMTAAFQNDQPKPPNDHKI